MATEAQYKTTYNISIVALEEAKGTLLAYDNIAVAEGPHPGKAYTQARDIQGAHRRFQIAPDGPQMPQKEVGPLNTDPADNNPPPGLDPSEGPLPLPGPSGPLGPRPSPVAPFAPVQLRPTLSQTAPVNGSARPAAAAGATPSSDVRLTGGPQTAGGSGELGLTHRPGSPRHGSDVRRRITWEQAGTSHFFVQAALFAGVRYIDTSETYERGNAERTLGRVLEHSRCAKTRLPGHQEQRHQNGRPRRIRRLRQTVERQP